MTKSPITDQQSGTPRPFSLGREQILTRLWELAHLSPEVTRGSITGQMKALSLIVAIEGLIPDRRRAAVPAQSASPNASAKPNPEPPPAPANPFVHTNAMNGRDIVYDAQIPRPIDVTQLFAAQNGGPKQNR